MSPVDELLVVVALLYVYESAVLVPRDAVAFTSWTGGAFKIREPTGLLGNERFGLLIAPLLPPLGTIHVARGRSAAPEKLAAALDVEAVRRDVERFRAVAGPLRLLCNALFLYFFALLPWIGHRVGLAACWLELLLGLVALVAAIVVAFLRAHRRLFPEKRAERRKLAVPLALAPLESVRAVDRLARSLLAERDPVAVALALASTEEARSFAQRELLSTLHPLPSRATNDKLDEARDKARAGALSTMLAANGVDVAALLRAPPRDSAQSLSWCPRCRAQYASATGACTDCPGVALVVYS